MKSKNIKTEKRVRRHKKIRAKILGTAKRPRLSVFRSNRFMYAQLVDDEKNTTIASFSSLKLKGKKATMLQKAKETGTELAKIAKEKKINEAVFDRGGFEYKGKVRALAEGAREGGLKF